MYATAKAESTSSSNLTPKPDVHPQVALTQSAPVTPANSPAKPTIPTANGTDKYDYSIKLSYAEISRKPLPPNVDPNK